MRCPKYGFEITDKLKQSYCRFCTEDCGTKPRFDPLPKVDIFELARRLAEKEGRDINSDREKKEV